MRLTPSVRAVRFSPEPPTGGALDMGNGTSRAAEIGEKIARNLASFRRAYDAGGLRGLAQKSKQFVVWRLDPRKRAFRRDLRRETEAGLAFDERYGTDTIGEALLRDLGVPEGDVERGHGLYRSVWPHIFRDAMQAVKVDFPRYTFVDYGSGKGKVLLLASDIPFRRIVGIEYAPGLHEIAAKNVRVYRGEHQLCHDLLPIHGDAIDYGPPGDPLVCFFFNPFDADTLGRVLDHLVRSYDASPRQILLVYANTRDVAEQEHVFRGHPRLVHVARQAERGQLSKFVVYEISGALR